MKGIFVGIEALIFVGVEEALREGVGRDVFISFMGLEGHFNGFHEANIDEIFVFDLIHEVRDNVIHLSRHE